MKKIHDLIKLYTEMNQPSRNIMIFLFMQDYGNPPYLEPKKITIDNEDLTKDLPSFSPNLYYLYDSKNLYPFFYSIEFLKNGDVDVLISPEAQDYLRDLKDCFFKYDIVNTSKFKKVKTIEFFTNIIRGQGQGFYDTTVPKLRKLMGITPSQYKQFSDLQKRVIIPALEDIANATQWNIKLQRLEGNKLRFHIHYSFNPAYFVWQDKPEYVITDPAWLKPRQY